MYLAMFGILLAWGIWLENFASLILMFGFIPYMNRFQIYPEETAMRQLFGSNYLDYCQKVKRWL